MRKFWLVDQHGSDGPTALVETDGGLRVVDVLRFGPSIIELEAQQKVWDDVIGRVAPTMKPFVNASELKEEGIAPLDELDRSDQSGSSAANRAGRRAATRTKAGAGRTGGGPSRSRSRGER